MNPGRPSDPRRLVSVRRGPGLPVEVLVWDRGELRVFPLSPMQALTLAENLVELAVGRLQELARRLPEAAAVLHDEEPA